MTLDKPNDSSFEIDVVEMTIAEAQEGFEKGRFSSKDLTQAFLTRIERFEPFYNAFTFMNPDALKEAQAVDERRSAGERLGPLAGIPVVIKESMDFAGLPSTAGWDRLSKLAGGCDLVPERDATVVARLKAAGAIILGKTNIPFFSHSYTSANTSWDGPTFNAVDRAIAPGGSSTGTATAIAASFAIVGLAEETGGSIQCPAAAQGLVSVKPTFALVPNSGVTPIAGSTRDVVGPHARTVTDAALLLDAIAGYSAEDSKTVAAIGQRPPGGYAAGLRRGSLQGARVGLYGSGWRAQTLSAETQSLYRSALAEFSAQNAVLVPDPFAGTDFASLALLAHQDFPFDCRGVESMAYDLDQYLQRLGSSAAANSYSSLLSAAKSDPFAAETPFGFIVQFIPKLKALLSDPTKVPDLSEFLLARESYLRTFNAVMTGQQLDFLAFPQVSSDLPGIFSQDQISATTVSEINISGLPGVTLPAGRFASGAPFSLILIGRMWSEGDLLAYAYDFEQSTRHRIIPTLEDWPVDAP